MTLNKGVKIVSDGTRSGTIITDIETGKALCHVQGFVIRLDPMQIKSTVDLLLSVPFEYEGPAHTDDDEVAAQAVRMVVDAFAAAMEDHKEVDRVNRELEKAGFDPDEAAG